MGTRGGEGGQDSTLEALGSPPGVDPVAMERVRSRAELRLFGASTPPRIGRYEVEDAIGGGGMGIVYRAFDPQLRRRVALKVLNPLRNQDPHAHQRMLLEARALAKLDHPNVVKVHDAMLVDQQIVVVMELLDGETLERWCERPRRWREILDVYAQAAEGLSAAHSVGVVHRDFKPSNAVIGRDGRVRVLDFGLARLADAPLDPPSSGATEVQDVTATGVVLGTLAYASPEQLAGQRVTAVSDQFSFSVALHVAIEGMQPFSVGDIEARLASIESGEVHIARDGRRVPVWLRAVIARGLAANPAARFSAMSDIAGELRRARGWQRWRVPVVALGSLAIAIGATAVLAKTEPPRCDGGAALVAKVWSPAIRERVGRALDEAARRYAGDVGKRTLEAIDHYAADWRFAHEATCRAHQRGETSAILLDRQMTCLARRFGDLRAAVGVLSTINDQSITRAMDVASAIPSAAPCTDLELVQRDVVPPPTLDLWAPIEAIRARISSAEALARAARDDEALALLASTARDARATGYGPIEVEHALAEGRIHLARADLSRAITTLAAARKGAFEHQMFAVAVEASARLIYAEGTVSPQLSRLEGELATLLPLSAGLHGNPAVRALLLNNVGAVYLAAGRRSDAENYFTQAKDEIRRHGIEDLELANVDLNLAMITRDTPKREALARTTAERLSRTLGAHHHLALDALYAYAMYVTDPHVAFGAMTRVATLYEQYHPKALRQRQLAAMKRALLAVELGDVARAETLYVEANLLLSGDTDPDAAQWRALCTGELALLRHEYASAVEAFARVIAARSASPHWWERADSARATVGLGLALAARGDTRQAIEQLEAAVRAYPALLANNEEVEPRRIDARARRALAELKFRNAKPSFDTNRKP